MFLVVARLLRQRNEQAERARTRQYLQVAEACLAQDPELALRVLWTAAIGRETAEIRDGLARALLRTDHLPRIRAHDQAIRSLCSTARVSSPEASPMELRAMAHRHCP